MMMRKASNQGRLSSRPYHYTRNAEPLNNARAESHRIGFEDSGRFPPEYESRRLQQYQYPLPQHYQDRRLRNQFHTRKVFRGEARGNPHPYKAKLQQSKSKQRSGRRKMEMSTAEERGPVEEEINVVDEERKQTSRKSRSVSPAKKSKPASPDKKRAGTPAKKSVPSSLDQKKKAPEPKPDDVVANSTEESPIIEAASTSYISESLLGNRSVRVTLSNIALTLEQVEGDNTVESSTLLPPGTEADNEQFTTKVGAENMNSEHSPPKQDRFPRRSLRSTRNTDTKELAAKEDPGNMGGEHSPLKEESSPRRGLRSLRNVEATELATKEDVGNVDGEHLPPKGDSSPCRSLRSFRNMEAQEPATKEGVETMGGERLPPKRDSSLGRELRAISARRPLRSSLTYTSLSPRVAAGSPGYASSPSAAEEAMDTEPAENKKRKTRGSEDEQLELKKSRIEDEQKEANEENTSGFLSMVTSPFFLFRRKAKVTNVLDLTFEETIVKGDGELEGTGEVDFDGKEAGEFKGKEDAELDVVHVEDDSEVPSTGVVTSFDSGKRSWCSLM